MIQTSPTPLSIEPMCYYAIYVGTRIIANPYSANNVFLECSPILTFYRSVQDANDALSYYEGEHGNIANIIHVPENLIDKSVIEMLPKGIDLKQVNITHVIVEAKSGDSFRLEFCENGVDQYRLEQLRLIWKSRLSANSILFVMEETNEK